MIAIYVLCGGALGALGRFLVGTLAERWLGSAYPWGTTFVNLAGSFLAGLVFAAFAQRGGLPDAVRLAALTGFLGAFTTFSTLMFEVATLFQGGRTGQALLHLAVHNGLGLGCVFAGLWLGRAL